MLMVHRLSETREQHDEQQTEQVQPSCKCHDVHTAVSETLLIDL